MTCSLFDVVCKLNAFFAPFIFWGKIAILGIIILAILWGLAWVYRNFGWWGLAVVLTLGAASAIFYKGVEFGKAHSGVLPEATDKPTKAKKRPKPVVVPDSWFDKVKRGEKV